MIVLAFGNKLATRRVGVWIYALETTILHLVQPKGGVPVFTGNDDAYKRDVDKAKWIEAIGWLVLVVGFALQFVASLAPAA